MALLGATLLLGNIRFIFAAEVGGNAPNCALNTIGTNQSASLQQFQGKVLLVDFWASWCSICAQSFPFLNTLHQRYQAKGLQIVGINVDEKPGDAQHFLSKHPANFIVANNVAQDCARDFDVKAMPSSYLIDRHGVVRYIHLGFRAGEVKQLHSMVEQLLAEKS